MYFPWSQLLGESIELWTVQLPGRGLRISEPLVHRFTDILTCVAPAIARLLDKPTAIFGHSLGARLGFEVARWLRRHGFPPPIRLFASASAAPHVRHYGEALSSLPDSELILKLKEFNGLPDAALKNAELLELVLPVVRADFAIAEHYCLEIEPPLDMSIDALYGFSDNTGAEERASAWREHTTGAFTLRGFPGDHFYLHQNRSPVLAHVVSALQLAPAYS
jgi:medium-chain acyl-[acyl-carrier-protein] hydrolase